MESVGLKQSDFLQPGVVVQLGYPPVRIDLLTTATGVSFEDCWERRVRIDVGSVEAGFISYADLTTGGLDASKFCEMGRHSGGRYALAQLRPRSRASDVYSSSWPSVKALMPSAPSS